MKCAIIGENILKRISGVIIGESLYQNVKKQGHMDIWVLIDNAGDVEFFRPFRTHYNDVPRKVWTY